MTWPIYQRKNAHQVDSHPQLQIWYNFQVANEQLHQYSRYPSVWYKSSAGNCRDHTAPATSGRTGSIPPDYEWWIHTTDVTENRREISFTRVCNHVIAVYSENKLQHYATAYRNHKSAGEKLGLFRFCKFFMYFFFQQIHYSLFINHFLTE